MGMLAVIFAVSLMAINPIENFNKATDLKVKALTQDFVQSSHQYFAETKKYPWIQNNNCMNELTIGGSLTSMPNCIRELTGGGKFEMDYTSMKELRDIYVNKCGDSAVLCFNPKSKAFNQTREAKYTKYGAQNPSCPPVIDTSSPDCYICIPIGNNSQCYNIPSHTPTPTLTNYLTYTPTLMNTLTPFPENTITPTPLKLTPSVAQKPTLIKCLNNPSSTPTPQDCLTNPNSPPTVSISSSSCIVTAGTPFTFTVSGSSCSGLASVWWYGAGGPDVYDSIIDISYPVSPTSSQMFTVPFSNPARFKRAYGSPLFTTAQKVHNYSFTTSITLPTAGTYKIAANARDVLYPFPGQPHQASEGMGIQLLTVQVVE